MFVTTIFQVARVFYGHGISYAQRTFCLLLFSSFPSFCVSDGDGGSGGSGGRLGNGYGYILSDALWIAFLYPTRMK